MIESTQFKQIQTRLKALHFFGRLRSDKTVGEEGATTGCQKGDSLRLFGSLFVFVWQKMQRRENMYNHSALERAKEIDKPILLTPNETAATGVMSLYSIRKGIANNTIPFVKIGAHYKINYTKLLKQLEEC